MSTKKTAVLMAAGMAVCVLAFFWLRERPKSLSASGDDSREETGARRIKTGQAKGAVGGVEPVADSPDGLTASAQRAPDKSAADVRTPQKNTQPSGGGRTEPDRDGALLAKIDDLLDDDDYDKLLDQAAALIKHPNPEVRSKLAFGLHWAGLRGLADLTTMLGDPDPEVAQEALDYWKTALADIESSDDKAAMLDAAYTVTGDFTEDGLVDDLLSEMLFVEDELAAAAHLMEMARQSKNPAHQEKFIETMDSISMPDEESANIQQAINNLNKWASQEKRERAEEVAAEIEAGPEPGQATKGATDQPAATGQQPAANPAGPEAQ